MAKKMAKKIPNLLKLGKGGNVNHHRCLLVARNMSHDSSGHNSLC